MTTPSDPNGPWDPTQVNPVVPGGGTPGGQYPPAPGQGQPGQGQPAWGDHGAMGNPYGQPNPEYGQPYQGEPYGPPGQYPNQPYGPTDQFPNQPYDPSAAAGQQFAGQPYGYPGQPRPRNSLALPALIVSVFAPVVGVILAHMSLSQIRKRNEDGRSLAMAGLGIGYTLMAVGIVATVLVFTVFKSDNGSSDSSTIAQATTSSSSDDPSDDDSTTTSRSRTTTTYRYPSTSRYPSSTTYRYPSTTRSSSSEASITDATIRAARIGDCLHEEELPGTNPDGSKPVSIRPATCGTARATYKVVDIVSDKNNCSGGTQWVQTLRSPVVVLCVGN